MRSKGGVVVRALASHQCMWPGFKSRRRCHMWVEFVVGSLPCSKRFFSRYCGFPLSSQTNMPKFQFDQESGRRRTTMWMCYLQIVIYQFNSCILNHNPYYLNNVNEDSILKHFVNNVLFRIPQRMIRNFQNLS